MIGVQNSSESPGGVCPTSQRSRSHCTAKQAIAIALLSQILCFWLWQSDYRHSFSDGYDSLGIIAFVTVYAVAFCVYQAHRTSKILIISVFLTCYVGIYTALSYSGGFHWSQSGTVRYSSGLSMSDVAIWSPRGIYWQPYFDVDRRQAVRATFLGRFFSPLVYLDRRWFHPTIQLSAKLNKQ